MDIQFTAKIFAPDIEPRVRHKQIFETFDRLNSGEFMELTNDHDPKPLYYQFMMEREGEFSWRTYRMVLIFGVLPSVKNNN